LIHEIPLSSMKLSCIVYRTGALKSGHSTTAAYYRFASIIIVVHVIRLHLDRHYVSSPETLTTHSHTKSNKLFARKWPPALLRVVEKEQPFRYPS